METVSDIFQWVFTAMVGIIGFFLKGVMDKQGSLEEKFNDLHNFYVKKDDFKEFKDELWHKLDEMRDEIRKNGQ